MNKHRTKEDLPDLKGRYGFMMGTTSFIYPSGYRENVARLGKYFDEIELLFFEMPPDGRPKADLVNDLRDTAQILEIGYNLHLPLDLALADEDQDRRRTDTRLATSLIKSFLDLPVTSFTVHLNWNPGNSGTQILGKWHKWAVESLEMILAETMLDPRRISIENLAYPFEWAIPVIEELDLSICLDIGHLVRHSYNLKSALTNFGPRTTVVHFYGTNTDKDHGPLFLLPRPVLNQVADFLASYDGSLMLEVFNLDDLQACLATFKKLIPPCSTDVRKKNSNKEF